MQYLPASLPVPRISAGARHCIDTVRRMIPLLALLALCGPAPAFAADTDAARPTPVAPPPLPAGSPFVFSGASSSAPAAPDAAKPAATPAAAPALPAASNTPPPNATPPGASAFPFPPAAAKPATPADAKPASAPVTPPTPPAAAKTVPAAPAAPAFPPPAPKPAAASAAPAAPAPQSAPNPAPGAAPTSTLATNPLAAPAASSAPSAPSSAAPPAGIAMPTGSGPASTRGVAVKPPNISTAPVQGVALKFDNADIYEVVQTVMGDILKLNYIIDPSIQGKITLNTDGQISYADVYNILESILALNNLSIIRDGLIYKVVRDANAVRDSISFQAAGESSPLIQIIPLRFVQASQLVGTLKNFISPQGSITNDPTNHYLIIADRASNVAKVLDMARVLDVDYLRHVRIRMVQVSKSDATDMAREMETLFKTSGMFNWSGTDGNKVFFMPIVRMNAILIVAANDSLLESAEQWIRTLDDEPKAGSNIHIYSVVNSTAAHLADVVCRIYGCTAAVSTADRGTKSTTDGDSKTVSKGTTQTVARSGSSSSAASSTQAQEAGLSGSVQVIADERTNTLIVKASLQDYLQIKKVIEKIDTVSRQVLIQVTVAEVELNDKLQYGVEWWIKSNFGAGKFDENFHLGTGLTATNDRGIANPTDKVATGLTYLARNASGSVVGLLNLMSNDTSVNLLSTPHLMASDGKTAKIEVGQKQPIPTGSVSTPAATSSETSAFYTSQTVNYEPIGIMLEVTPTINESGLVTLELMQEVSSLSAPTMVGGQEYPSFNNRKVSTNVTLEEGRTLIIAGMIRGDKNRSMVGIPWLKDIPLLGTLFGTTSNADTRSELMITVTPYIVRNRSEGEQITVAFENALQGIKGSLEQSPGNLRYPKQQPEPPPAKEQKAQEKPKSEYDTGGVVDPSNIAPMAG